MSYCGYFSFYIDVYFTIINFNSHFDSLVDISLVSHCFVGMPINLMSMQAMLTEQKADADVVEEGPSPKKSKDKCKALVPLLEPLVIHLETSRAATVHTYRVAFCLQVPSFGLTSWSIEMTLIQTQEIRQGCMMPRGSLGFASIPLSDLANLLFEFGSPVSTIN